MQRLKEDKAAADRPTRLDKAKAAALAAKAQADAQFVKRDLGGKAAAAGAGAIAIATGAAGQVREALFTEPGKADRLAAWEAFQQSNTGACTDNPTCAHSLCR